MEIQFHADSREGINQHTFDLVLSACRSLQDVTKSLDMAVEDGRTELFVEFKPPIAASLSIPNAYQTMLTALNSKETQPLTVNVCVASEMVVEYLQEHCTKVQGTTKHYNCGELNVVIRMGNIAFATTDAIVNASNTLLKLGAGVSGAIANATQPGLQEEMYAIAQRRSIGEGDEVVTGSYGLPCSYIIHVATARGGAPAVQLAMRSVFRICNKKELSSVAIPALGTGTGGVPVVRFAEIASEEIKRLLDNKPLALKIIEFVMHTHADQETMELVFEKEVL
jgi:O-acetyl-ADP-ribose deacetylase (regulator of RNase III)